MLNFGEVLSRAWDIIWKNKILWVFGLLASLAVSGESGLNFQFEVDDSRFRMPFGNVERLFEQFPVWLPLLAFLLALVVVTVVIVASTIGRVGLTRGAWLADSGEERLTWSSLFAESQRYFWRALLLGILLWAIGLAAVLVVTVPIIFSLGLALLCLWPLYCLLLPFFYALTVLFNLAIVAVVNEDLDVMSALRRAWEIFRANLGEIIVMSLILLIGAAVINFLISLPMVIAAAPLAAALFSQSRGAMVGGLVLSGILFLVYLPFLLAMRAVLVSYINTAWTLTFRRLTGRTPVVTTLA